MSDRARLVEVMGRIKVWELARLAGASVEQVIAVVVRAARLPDFTRSAPTDAGRAAALATLRGRVAPPTEPPPLVELVGRATLRELDVVVDRWVLALVLHEHDWNVARLDISRRALRGRWAKVRDLPADRRGGAVALAARAAFAGQHPEPRGHARRCPRRSPAVVRGTHARAQRRQPHPRGSSLERLTSRRASAARCRRGLRDVAGPRATAPGS